MDGRLGAFLDEEVVREGAADGLEDEPAEDDDAD